MNDDSLKSSESKESLRRTPRTIQEDVEQSRYERTYRSNCIRRRPESGVMPHGTASDNYQLLFRHPVNVYIRYTKATFLSTIKTSCKKPCPQKTYLSQLVNFVVCHHFCCTLYFCKVLCCLGFCIVLTFGVIHKATITKFTAILSFIFSGDKNHDNEYHYHDSCIIIFYVP